MNRPNIVFMHVDQLHWDAMSEYGNPYVKTPGMDRIAKEGCSFRSSYATMPVCVPARTSWYTGRMSCENGATTNANVCRPDIPDLGQWLRKEGAYDSVYAGKWHVNGRDFNKSFRVLYGVPTGQGEYMDGAVARACMGYLDNYTDDKPFFLNAGFLNPHDCCFTAGAKGGQGKFKFAEKLKGNMPPLPENWVPPKNQAKMNPHWTREDWEYYRYCYYRWVEMVDAEVASLYDYVRNSRFADNTVIIFTADHGDGLGFHGNLSKGYMEDESWRVPLIIVDPRGKGKGVVDFEHLTTGVDIPATICDYAQVPPLPKMTIGTSLKPLVEGKKMDWREYVVGEAFNPITPQVGVRDERYKTIFYAKPQMKTKVFDLEKDPLEMNNLMDTPERGEEVMKKHQKYLCEYTNTVEIYEPMGSAKKGAHTLYLDFYDHIRQEVSR